MKKINFLFFLTLLFPFSSFCWDGFDWENGAFVEIEKGNLVREGEPIEVFDYQRGRYIDMEVNDVNTFGSGVEIEATDLSSGEVRTFDMD